jgi:hypothetical protein
MKLNKENEIKDYSCWSKIKIRVAKKKKGENWKKNWGKEMMLKKETINF